MNRAHLIASIVFVFLSTQLLHADPLAPLLDEALRVSPSLQAVEQQWQAARQRIGAERGLDDPMVGADVERSNTRIDDYMDVEYMVSQRLPAWGQRRARVEAARLRAEAAGFRYLEAGRRLRADVAEAAWSLWLADRRIETLRETARLVSDLTDSVRARYEAGQAMSVDLVRTQIEQVKLTNEIAGLRRERDVALAALNAILNAAPDFARDVSGLSSPAPLPMSRDGYLARARDFCCLLVAFDKESQARAALARAARRERRPMVELRVEARQFEGRGGIEEIDTGVFFNLPWVWQGKYRGMIAEADAERQMAAAELQEEIRKTEQEVSELHMRAENAWSAAALLRESVIPLAQQAVEQTQSAYTAGTGSFLDRIEAQRALLEAELDQHAAVAEFARARARLDQVAGPFLEWEQATGALPETMQRRGESP